MMFNGKIFDQFLLAEQIGVVASAQAVSIFRFLLNNGGSLGEGTLAAKASMRLYRPDWQPLISKLHEMGYVSFSSSGHAMSRIVHLTDKAKELLGERGIIAEPETANQPEPQSTE